MTPMKEDYLKIIFELGGANKLVSNKQIAISLDIAAGSVTEMVNKMVDEDLVTHKPYSGVRLTASGTRYAEELVRKHRIWETFLINVLHFDLPDVHREAEQLEHVTSNKMIDHLDDFLGHPKRCPHGGIIPDKDGHYEKDHDKVLMAAKDGEEVVVNRFIDNHDLLTLLGDIKLDLGDRLKILSHDPFEGSVIAQNLTDKKKLTIGYKTAHYVFVK
ncbi:metal-dependent transcriptional regulator [Lentilactobacillus farraginis]|uniref:Manganese transport regulator n=1 Tax=Lentilactobacillus farraginis DSM 18382 = JCM 14108 TaxID=1423743 RepID=A0A0R1VKV4_9LACO|nr:metal-dependent transcriptional regulator [Lentilactobacillus farraginis]KRM04443.1 metal-dependent transcriptional regulator [Lentilactobacillus farraginis DSM 18382 = JCM 14108]